MKILWHFWIPHEILTLDTQQVHRVKITPSGLKMPMTYLVQNSRGTLFWAKKRASSLHDMYGLKPK